MGGKAVVACALVTVIAIAIAVLAVFQTDQRDTDDKQDLPSAVRVGELEPKLSASRDVELIRQPERKNETRQTESTAGNAAIGSDGLKFPRGLGTFIDEVLAAKDPYGAYKAAKALRECEFSGMQMDSEQRAVSSSSDLKVRQAHVEKYQAMQARASQCQTVDGEMAEKQLALLALAVEGGVPGAAAAQLALDPRLTSIVAERLSADAQLGDIESITQLIWRSPEELGIAPDLHQAITQALQKARHDERVAVLANSYMDVAISWASVRQSKNPKNSSALVASLTNPVSPSTEAKAQQIFQAIKARYGS
jgi:hypothetical protein